jgi:hypothetical protein
MQLFETTKKIVLPREINIIYDGTTIGSPARKLMVDYYWLYGTPVVFEERYWVDINLDFTRDLLKAMVKTKPAV